MKNKTQYRLGDNIVYYQRIDCYTGKNTCYTHTQHAVIAAMIDYATDNLMLAVSICSIKDEFSFNVGQQKAFDRLSKLWNQSFESIAPGTTYVTFPNIRHIIDSPQYKGKESNFIGKFVALMYDDEMTKDIKHTFNLKNK